MLGKENRATFGILGGHCPLTFHFYTVYQNHPRYFRL